MFDILSAVVHSHSVCAPKKECLWHVGMLLIVVVDREWWARAPHP